MSKSTATEVKETKVVPKGTVKTEVILGTAVSKLGSGVKFLAEMMSEINKLEEKVNENVLLISDQEDKITTKALELKNTIAQNKIELQQMYESDKKAFVQLWLNDNNYIVMDREALTKMEQELEGAEDAAKKDMDRELAILRNTLTSKHASEKREYELEFKAKEAETKAALNQKDEKIKFLEEQVGKWQTAAAEAQKANVEIAKAGSIQNLNLSSDSRK
jgi:hypothetical protein